MKTEIRLSSIVENGVGEPEANALELIYSFLLSEYNQDFYDRIAINQIGSDMNEFVSIEAGKKIHCNINYMIHGEYKKKNIDERNTIMLDVVHKALIKISEYDKKLDISKLEKIRNRILEANFVFEFVYKEYPLKQKSSFVGKIIIHPLMDRSIISVLIEDRQSTKCKQVIYTGISGSYYFDKFFCYGKWKNDNELIISGKDKCVETHISINTCTVIIVNLTSYKKPPYYTLMKFGISEKEKALAYKDWEHSLAPHIASVIRNANN